MKLNTFISKISDKINSENLTPILHWVQFAQDVSEASESALDIELDQIYRALCFVKNNFDDSVFQKSLNTVLPPNEIIYGAAFFNAGYSDDEVRKYAENGVFEGGYIPFEDDEFGTLSLVEISETELLLARNESADLISACIQFLSSTDKVHSIADTLLQSKLHLSRINQNELKTVLRKAFDNTTSIGEMISFSPAEKKVSNRKCPALEQTDESDPQKKHDSEIEKTNELITAEDSVETSIYLANAPDCCSSAEQLDHILRMLGANVMDDDIYHSEDEHQQMSM